MKQVNLYQAKTSLSALVEEAASGEEIVIAKNGKPCAKLVPLQPPPPPLRPVRFGRWNHLGFTVPDSFDDWDDELEDMFYGPLDADPLP